MTICNEILALDESPVETTSDLSERTIWSKHCTTVWQANRFTGSPNFYPVYRYQDYYSYSLFSLIVFKGNFRLNSEVAGKISNTNLFLDAGTNTIDRDIVRIGKPLNAEYNIKDAETYARMLAEAMCEDIAPIETDHSGFTNVILCGGKDSLNLSLLPWRNPVLIASAPPNYELARTFMTDNGLPYEVIPLEDTDDTLLETEILVNCCRNNLEHCRWGPHLRKIAQDHDGKVVFWKGQLGDIITTQYWKWFACKRLPVLNLLKGRGARAMQICFEGANTALVPPFNGGAVQRLAFERLWTVCAMWQGTHVGFVRELTDALVLSGYHGPAVEKVVSQVDLNRAVQTDIRPLLGKYLHGEDVVYPSTNPGPPRSEIRQGISDLQPFLKALRSAGITIHDRD